MSCYRALGVSAYVFAIARKAEAVIAKVLNCDEERRIAVNIAKPLGLLGSTRTSLNRCSIAAGSRHLLKRFVNRLDDGSALMNMEAAAKAYDRCEENGR
jgi:hypothetical protein